MKKKKIIIAGVFLTLIAFTAVYTVVSAVLSYQYDMANGVDIFEGFGAVITMMVGGFIVLYEIDLFYTVYYFFIKPKTIARSILNVLSNVSLFLIFFCEYYADIFEEDGMAPLVVFLVYVVFRIIYCFVPERYLEKEQ